MTGNIANFLVVVRFAHPVLDPRVELRSPSLPHLGTGVSLRKPGFYGNPIKTRGLAAMPRNSLGKVGFVYAQPRAPSFIKSQ